MIDRDFYDVNFLDFGLVLLYILFILMYTRKYNGLQWQIKILASVIGAVHILMSVVNYTISLGGQSDSKGYFKNSFNSDLFSVLHLGDGVRFISQLIYPFTNIIGVSYLGSDLIFSALSLLGIYKLYDVSLSVLGGWNKWLLIFLLPSIHFWTGYIGKDALVFFAISTFVYNAYFRKNYLHYILAVFLLMFARFYILTFVSFAFILTLVFLSNKIKVFLKILIGILSSVAAIFFIPFFFKVVGIAPGEDINKRKELITTSNMEGGSGIDLTDSSFFYKVFSYLFRPYFFEATSITTLMAAIENIIWMILFFLIISNLKKIIKGQDTLFWFCIVAFFCIVLPGAFLLSNLGIASRVKIQIIPFLFYVFFMMIRRQKSKLI